MPLLIANRAQDALGSDTNEVALLDDAGERLVDLDDAGPLRELRDGKPAHPPDTWIPGKVYVDQLTFTVPKNVKTWRVKIVAGIAKGEEKLKATGSEPHDGLYLVATSGTGIKRGRDSSAPSDDSVVPEVRLDRLDAKAKIKIDGKLDEEAWKETSQIKLVNIATGKFERKAALQGRARLLWSKEGLYVGFDVGDKDVVGGFKATDKDPHLWTKDTVEIMIDPDGDGDNQDYYEIQINPQNLVFDSHFDKYNEPKTEPDGPFGNQAWSSGVKSAVVVDGTLDKSDDKDTGYTVEALIPWKSLSKAKKTPPALGDTWRINLYAIQENSGVAWSPILGKGNLHFAPRFGKVLFAEKDWKPAEPVAAASGATPSPAAPNGVNAVVQAAKPPASATPAAPAPAAPAAAPASSK